MTNKPSKEIIKSDEAVSAEVINLKKNEPAESGRPRWRKLKILFFIIIFFAVSSSIFSAGMMISGKSSSSWIKNLPLIGPVKYLAESADKKLKGEERDRINILLLGMGGKNHDGGYLTDTIMVVSLKPSTKKVSMISIPRDLTVPVEGMGWRKINNINAFAEKQEPGSGGVAASQAVNDILSIPIDYYFRVDFDGFIKIIDQLGGVNVYAENTLDDYAYPVRGREDAYPYNSRFEHLHVEKGWQQMDGELALKFARSRHGVGAEGSDFARSRRQQKIIEATKDKIFSSYVLFRPKLVSDIIDTLSEHLSTNLKLWEMVKLWDMFKDVKSGDIINKVLDNSPGGLLVSAISPEGAFILTPKSGDFTEIQYMMENIFSDGPAEKKTEIISEKAIVEVLNGTWINGLASKVSLDLEKLGFDVARVANSSRQNFDTTVIFDLTYGEKANSIKVLKDKLKANVSYGLPDWLKEDLAKYANGQKETRGDFVVVLGRGADATASGMENPNQ